ncbi:MAG: hypothetical protein JWN25_2175 [Verrucomicrobiales bacterium]|nr:hypothetical protein [Verrucomicrobiales bacterium]MDB6130228.1 hypothetical protein [Verrucomicrobiales bacterium]
MLWNFTRKRDVGFAIIALLVLVGVAPQARAQTDVAFIPHTSPYPLYLNPEARRYNIKWGNLEARFITSAQVEFNDNIILSGTKPEGDISFGPDLQIGFQYPLSKRNTLEFNVGLGYRFYLEHPQLATFTVAPNSKIYYELLFDDVKLSVHDSFQVSVDPTGHPDISGSTTNAQAEISNFRRFDNSVGVQGDWKPYEDLTFSLNFDYAISRALTDSFIGLDADTYSWLASVSYKLSPRWIVGFQATYSWVDHLIAEQNNSANLVAGPFFSYKPSQFITVSGSASFSFNTFDDHGTTADTSEFSSIVAQLAIDHRMNSHTTESLHFSRSVGQGFGHNYNDTYTGQYNINTKLTSHLTVSASAVYEMFKASGTLGESADRFLLYFGTGYQLDRHWHLGMAYALALKNSDQTAHNYKQNRLTLELSRAY